MNTGIVFTSYIETTIYGDIHIIDELSKIQFKSNNRYSVIGYSAVNSHTHR